MKSAETAEKKQEGVKAESQAVAGEHAVQHAQQRKDEHAEHHFDYSVKLPDNASDRQKELAKEIEEQRRKKGSIIADVRRMKRRLIYKLAEKEATAKLVAQGKKSTKNIGYLRRRKENLEFRISTEAYTLEAEKDLIRKKNAVDEELDEAIKSYRMRRKSEFIEGDIIALNKGVEDAGKGLDEIEKKLDMLYGELRKLNGERARKSAVHQERKKQEQPKQVEVSLADIAVIKDKKSRESSDQNENE